MPGCQALAPPSKEDCFPSWMAIQRVTRVAWQALLCAWCLSLTSQPIPTRQRVHLITAEETEPGSEVSTQPGTSVRGLEDSNPKTGSHKVPS